MSIQHYRIPALLLGMLLCLILSFRLSPAAWADGSTAADLQAAVDRGDKSFTLTGSITIPEGTEIITQTTTVIVPKGKTLLMNGGILDVPALRLEGGDVEVRGKSILRVNDSFTRTGGSVKVYGGFNAFPAKDIWPDNTDAIQYPPYSGAARVTDLLFTPKNDQEFVSTVNTINTLTDNFVADILVDYPCTVSRDIVIRHKTMLYFNSVNGGKLHVTPEGSLRYENCGGTVTFRHYLPDLSGDYTLQDTTSVVEGTLLVNSMDIGIGCNLRVSGTFEAGTLNAATGYLELLEGCSFRVINSFFTAGKIKVRGPCYNGFPAANVYDTSVEDLFEYDDVDTVTYLYHYCKNNDDLNKALFDAKIYDNASRFKPDFYIDFAWDTSSYIDVPIGQVTIPSDSILRFRGDRGGSLLIPEGSNLCFISTGELRLSNGAEALVRGELNGDLVSVGENCELVVPGKVYANKLDIHQNARVNVDCGSLDVPGRIWNGGELNLIDSWIDTGAETWREADEGARDRIRFDGDSGINLHFEVEDGEQAVETLREASEIQHEHVRAQVEVRVKSWPISEKLTIPSGTSVNVHSGLTVFSDAALIVNGQLTLVDDSKAYFYGTLINAGFIETDKRSSGSEPRLIIEGGYYGPGSFGVKDTSKPDSYFSGLDLSLFRKEKDSIGTRYFPTTVPQPELTLPASLTVIEEEAFAGGSFRSVFIPQGVKRIDDSAFTGINPLIIFGYSGTEAQRFADENGFAFVSVS